MGIRFDFGYLTIIKFLQINLFNDLAVRSLVSCLSKSHGSLMIFIVVYSIRVHMWRSLCRFRFPIIAYFMHK